MKNIRNHVDNVVYEKFYSELNKLTNFEQNETREAVTYSAIIILLPNRNHVSEPFMKYLRKNPSSPFKRVDYIIIRHEYNKDAGNLSHIHLILEILWRDLN